MSLSPQSAQWLPVGVRVSVLRARGLRIKGKDGTNDAYVALQAGREAFRTPVAERLTEPVWGEESGAFVFTTPPDGAALQVRVMHRVPLGADKLLGLSVINLQELRSNLTENPQWFKLLNKAGKADKERGEVQLDVQFLKSSMSVSMIDLSDKSHSRFGKFKDKLRGKHKDSLGDSASAILPPTSQVLTDSEEEAEPQGEGETPKKKKNKLKSLFVPKSNLQRNVSQSMSALGTLPDRNSSISSSTSSGLNLEPSEGKGKKKFKFLTHKRNSSTDSKTSSQSNLFLSSTNQSATSQVGVCVNGSHVYSGEPEPLDVEEEEDEKWGQDEEAIEQMEEEKRRMERETEMRRKMEEEEKERTWRMAEEKRMEEERIRIQKIKEEQHRMMEEERKRTEEREAEEQRKKLEEDRKRRMAEEEMMERERMEKEQIKIEREKSEQIKRIQEDNERRMKMEREEEEKRKVKEERQRREEEIRKLAEEREMIEEQKRKSEAEERERIRVEKEEMEQRRRMEEKESERIRIEQEKTQKLEKEKERIMEEQRKESEERKRQENERERKRIEEMEEERIKAEKKRVEEEKEQERKRRMEEEENRMIEERKRAEKRLRDAEEKRKAKEEEQRQKEEDERMQVEKRCLEEKEQERMRRIEEENRIKDERIKMEKEQREKEEDERMRVEEERKIEELRRKKEKQRDEEEKKEKEENMSRSARISAKPSVSVTVIDSRSSVVNSNPLLDENDSDSSSSETVTDRTSKKGRAPLPPQKIPLVPNPDESLRDNTMSEGTKPPSKRPAPQPRVRLMVTKDESLNKETMEHTNPFTCDVPGTAEYKIKLAPKPEAVSSAFGGGLLNFAANQKEASCISEEPVTSYEGNKKEDMMTDWNPLGRSKQPSTSTAIQLDMESSDLFQSEETLKYKVLPDAVISNHSSSLLSEPRSTSGDVLNMEPFHKKSRAPLPPKDPKNLNSTQSSSPESNAISSESASVQERHGNKNNQNQNPETPASGGAHSLKSSLFQPNRSQGMQPSVSVEATDAGSGSALKALPCAKVAPGGGSEVMINSSSVIRQQAVRPLNSEPEANDMRSSQLLHHKPKAAEALNKGPYAQLTQPELISLALRQQEQISQRDGRIQQLEQYIDDLLVKVMEEKPSILMQLNTKNKGT